MPPNQQAAEPAPRVAGPAAFEGEVRAYRTSPAARDAGRLPIGAALVEGGLISEQERRWALWRQGKTGERVGQVVLAAGLVSRLDLQRALADQWDLPFIDLFSQEVDDALVAGCDPESLLELGWVPVHREGGRVVVAVCEPPSGEMLASIHDAFGPEGVELRATSPLDVERTVLRAFHEPIIARSTGELLARRPDLSAAAGYSRGQRAAFGASVVVAAVGLLAAWQFTLSLLIAAANVAFFGAVMFKLVACSAGFARGARRLPADVERDDTRLPLYTVLVPVYREANVIADLMRNLAELDYPQEKLEVLVLLEADDVETLEAAKAAKPPATVRLVIVPDAEPRTKPKACNVGLFLARGERLVIYDAEDRPEPQQLRKAVAAFEHSGEDTVCVQARLRYWNYATNTLTRMFALEYGYWFGTMLPGLDRLGLPIPLGGTSNHFRTAALREMLGWDPHNVTEDADLGLRAAVAGYRVGVIDSDTSEEACSRLRPWVRQRTRWIKGYMQTALVHTRSPRRLVRQIGLVDSLGFFLLIAGTPLTFLLAPVMWIGTACWYAFGEPRLPLVDSGVFWALALANLIVGNAVMIALNYAAAVREGRGAGALYAILNPLYWTLHSFAAWRALIQLVRRPFYWEKTPHGLGDAGLERPVKLEPEPAQLRI